MNIELVRISAPPVSSFFADGGILAFFTFLFTDLDFLLAQNTRIYARPISRNFDLTRGF